jgi:small subunit ribosomal protein S8
MTDPIADLLTRIRNAVAIDRKQVSIPYSKVKEQVCRVLSEEGFIDDYRITEEGHKTLHVFLKYGPDGERVINKIERVSKPGRRLYSSAKEMPRVLNGMGILVVSTSSGIMTDRVCREKNLGGELICSVW